VSYNSVAIFIRLAVVESQICEIPQNSLKIRTYTVQGRPKSSILVSIEIAWVLIMVRAWTYYLFMYCLFIFV